VSTASVALLPTMPPQRIDDARGLYISRNALIGDQIDFLAGTGIGSLLRDADDFLERRQPLAYLREALLAEGTHAVFVRGGRQRVL
jgi:hypothetical protein